MVGNEFVIEQYRQEMEEKGVNHWLFQWQIMGLEDDSTCNWCRLKGHRGPYLLREIERIEKESYGECLNGNCRCMVVKR